MVDQSCRIVLPVLRRPVEHLARKQHGDSGQLRGLLAFGVSTSPQLFGNAVRLGTRSHRPITIVQRLPLAYGVQTHGEEDCLTPPVRNFLQCFGLRRVGHA